MLRANEKFLSFVTRECRHAAWCGAARRQCVEKTGLWPQCPVSSIRYYLIRGINFSYCFCDRSTIVLRAFTVGTTLSQAPAAESSFVQSPVLSTRQGAQWKRAMSGQRGSSGRGQKKNAAQVVVQRKTLLHLWHNCLAKVPAVQG